MLSLDAAKLNLTYSLQLFPNAVPGTIATPASCIAFWQNSAPFIPVPGTAFGKSCNEYVRFSFAASRDNISQALENIKKMLG